MNVKKFNTPTFVCVAFICLYAFGLLTGYGIFRCTYDFDKADKQKTTQAEIKIEPDWSLVENSSLDIDMEKIGVTLIKRTFDDEGIEATLLEFGDNQKRYLMCSREVHEKLVTEFQEILKARRAEGP
jgi:hypothetical protein